MPFDLTPRNLSLAAAGGSLSLLIAALGFQAIGYAPCELCILQRWPHVVAVLIGAAIFITGFRPLWALLGMIAAAVVVGLASYHTGVELGWWAGPTACTGGIGDIAGMSPADLVNRIRSAPTVRCDQPAWMFLGLSMAAWNAILSAVLLLIWARALMIARAPVLR